MSLTKKKFTGVTECSTRASRQERVISPSIKVDNFKRINGSHGSKRPEIRWCWSATAVQKTYWVPPSQMLLCRYHYLSPRDVDSSVESIVRHRTLPPAFSQSSDGQTWAFSFIMLRSSDGRDFPDPVRCMSHVKP